MSKIISVKIDDKRFEVHNRYFPFYWRVETTEGIRYEDSYGRTRQEYRQGWGEIKRCYLWEAPIHEGSIK